MSPSETQPIGAPTASTGPGITAFTSTSIPTFSSGTVETSSAVRGSAHNTSDYMSMSATRSVPFGPTGSTQMASGTSISHSSGARNFPVAIVAGAAAGGAAALTILILAICCVRRRRRASSDERGGDDRVSQARIPTQVLDATLPTSINSTLLERPSPHINDSWDSEEALLSGMSISGIRGDDPSSDTGISTFALDTDMSLEGSHQEKVETHSDALPPYMSAMENSDNALQQQHRPSLRRHRLSLHPPASTGNVDVVPDNAAMTHDEVEMRRQIELLRSEVERLRVEIEPPAYE
ncbi:hypothetical protein WOLCODRAFT_161316 [Wolfiporia cocos MD-104 SS10]|uniref:Uncharacterized protein n=1 Tax=Wolfiporia cocos (strain MD-104) TaxID=742152 RepID=A0A2H3JN92_WOLCO|nr:hypothetical protein WOLCODRAFT_161316 [Wolfiporia cocos MD-104 SS10]